MAGAASLEARFIHRFPNAENRRLFRAPGRVNLIGEHTDYNQGFVLPMAISLACYAVTGTASDNRLRVYSESQKDGREWTIDDVRKARPAHDWTDYFIGVAQQLMAAGIDIQPGSVLLHSTVPLGGGLSSSAAVEVVSALALLAGRTIDPLELVKLCQRAENQFVGLPSGIMDQYVSVFGHPQSALQLDCRSLTHKLVPLPDTVAFLTVNTMVKHSLSKSAYRERVEECRIAAEKLGVASLRDATRESVEAAREKLGDVPYRRAWHVVTENERVGAFAQASEAKNCEAMGKLLLESHASLRNDYEVSCEELDFLVEHAMRIEGVYGARMIGGGFGGCTLNMIRPDALDDFESEIRRSYEERFGIRPEIYPCSPSAGALETVERE